MSIKIFPGKVGKWMPASQCSLWGRLLSVSAFTNWLNKKKRRKSAPQSDST